LQKGGFHHDGRFATLSDVVQHDNTQFNLDPSDAQKKDLTEHQGFGINSEKVREFVNI
jgi:hypothetical protein